MIIHKDLFSFNFTMECGCVNYVMKYNNIHNTEEISLYDSPEWISIQQTKSFLEGNMLRTNEGNSLQEKHFCWW
jgi:hypothetical protein